MARGEHAIVMGASIAGLASARALSKHFDRVTVVERDVLPPAAENRKGVPQGNHAHGLLASGYRVLDAYFPGMFDEIEACGARRGDVTGDFLWYQYGNWKLRTNSGLGGIVVSRPLLEASVRKYTRAVPNIEFLEGFDCVAPTFEAGRVTGLAVKDRQSGEEKTLPADIVVDATGRGSQSPKWLREWGYPEVPESQVEINVGYASGVFERKPTDLGAAWAPSSPARCRRPPASRPSSAPKATAG